MGDMSAKELMKAMCPDAKNYWQLCVKLAPVFSVSVSTVYRWRERNYMPPNAKLIAQLYIGVVTLGDIEDMIESAH